MFSTSLVPKKILVLDGLPRETAVMTITEEEVKHTRPNTLSTISENENLLEDLAIAPLESSSLASVPRYLPGNVFFQTAEAKHQFVSSFNWHGNTGPAIPLKEVLHHGIAEMIESKEGLLTIACASQDKKRIYLYHIQASAETRYKINEEARCVYACTNDFVVDLKLVKIKKETFHAIYFSSGKIEFGKFSKGMFVVYREFDGVKDGGVGQLFFSSFSGNRLININSSGHLKWWSLDKDVSGSIKLPALYNFKMSSSGRYFTAMVNQGLPQSNEFCVLDLAKHFHVHRVKHDEPLYDVYVGKEEKLYQLAEDKVESLGVTNEFLLSYFEKESKKAKESIDALDLRPAVKKSNCCWGLFNKKEKPKSTVFRNNGIPHDIIPNPLIKRH